MADNKHIRQDSFILSTAVAVLLALAATHASAGQMDLATFNLLTHGMSESEVLVRAGRPDLDVPVGEVGAKRTVIGDNGKVVEVFTRTSSVHVRELHYIPDRSEHDPHLTVITITGGRVTALHREKVFSRGATQSSGSPHTSSDESRKIERAARTLDAAEDYAAIRQGYLSAADEAMVSKPAEPRVYRLEQDDGSVYYGDRQPH